VSTPYVAEIRIFPFNFAPVGWALCNGQLMPISQNTALFSLIGTYFGGDGRSTFALPNLQGSIPVDQGAGAGLTPRDLGQTGGEASVSLLISEVPPHTHGLQASPHPADLNTPAPTAALARSEPAFNYTTPASAGTPQPLAAGALGNPVGGNRPHNNLMPYLTLNYCIALQGVYPPRS
jgi:microcystin-dependent protein